LLKQRGQVAAEAGAVLVAAATLAVAAVSAASLAGALGLRQLSMVAALEERQPSTVAAFAEHRLSGAHILPAGVSGDQVSHLDSTMAAPECLP
jgi:hypothetical protein